MVAIKDMSMPKNCAYCRFRIYERCYITDKRIDNYNCPQIKDGGCPLVEAIPKAEYEARLKADMVAMLEELKEQLREMHEDYFETEHYDEAYGVSVSMAEIQQKIDKLREVEE